jgi:hypothetical protein
MATSLGPQHDRDLHRGTELNMTRLHASLAAHELFDVERYRAELDQLGRDGFIS